MCGVVCAYVGTRRAETSEVDCFVDVDVVMTVVPSESAV